MARSGDMNDSNPPGRHTLKLKMTLAIAGLAALAISSGTATAGNGDKITGGGQVVLDTENPGARTSTLAFTAQGTDDAGGAKGQVQLIDRQAGTGKSSVRFHGVVTCVETGPGPDDENFGIASGHKRGDDSVPFVLRVIDNGQPNEGTDLIQFDRGDDANDTCGDDNDDAELSGQVAHGNAKVRDGDTENQPEFEEKNGSASALSFLGL